MVEVFLTMLFQKSALIIKFALKNDLLRGISDSILRLLSNEFLPAPKLEGVTNSRV